MDHYYVFCKDLIAVRTSISNFKWVFGRNAPEADETDFNRCLIRLSVDIDDDNAISAGCDDSMVRFADYYGNFGENFIIYKKHIRPLGNLAYKISRNGNYLNVTVGKRYLRLVKYKVMHIHPMYYILFDFVTALLLESGFTPIYASAVKLANSKTVLMVAPPNTGKSLTSLRLVNEYDASLISEDIAVTDGSRVWPVPYTDTYRRYRKIKPQKTAKNFSEVSEIDSLYWLSHGDSNIKRIREEDYEKIQLLNDYLLGYAKSPAVDAFFYFNQCFKNTNLLSLEERIIKTLLNNVAAYYVFEADAMQYAATINSETLN